ncbi:MAG: hypothetical protein F4022_13885 [Gemmatimonadetes bacterium]|nr:hypothetical protein [Gemmatimonadota bacterium]
MGPVAGIGVTGAAAQEAGRPVDGELAVWDRSRARVTLVGTEGVIREAPGYDRSAFAGPATRVAGSFADGALVITADAWPISAPQPGPFRDTVRFEVLVPDQINHMLGDLDGRLWLRIFRPGEEAEHWQVWDMDGPSLEFTLTLREEEELLDAAGNRVLMRTRGEFDVEYLVLPEIEGYSLPGVSRALRP